MIASQAAQIDPNTLVSAYEALRKETLEGVTSRRLFGLAVLLRQGMRAWMEGQTTYSPAKKEQPASNKATTIPQLDSEGRASLVQVLASMVIAGQGEPI